MVAGSFPDPVHEGSDVVSPVPCDELVGQPAQLLLGDSFTLQMRTGVVGQKPGGFDLRRLGFDVAQHRVVGALLIL